MNNNVPPCADWNVWLGKEIEGSKDLGQLTLFVRRPRMSLATVVNLPLLTGRNFSRLWLCKEFFETHFHDSLADELHGLKHFLPGLSLCAEISVFSLLSDRMTMVVETLRENNVSLYFKLPMSFKDGDHLCVGPAYSDEAFLCGEGKKVSPDQYLKDEFIL